MSNKKDKNLALTVCAMMVATVFAVVVPTNVIFAVESAGENLYHISPLRHKFPFQVVLTWRCWPRPASGSGSWTDLLWDIESIVKQGRDGPALDVAQ